MKKFLAVLVEGAIVSVVMGITMILLELDTSRLWIVVAVAMLSTSAARVIGGLISKGEDRRQ